MKRAGDTRLRDQTGSTLVGVVVLVVAMLVTLLAVVRLGALDARLVRRHVEHAQTLFLAEAGLERACAWFEAQRSPPEDTSPFHPFGDLPETLGDGSYAVSVEPDPLNPTLYPKYYTIASTGYVGRHTRSLELVVSPQSFADFLYFTDREHMQGGGNPVWFVSPDLIDGPLHTNDQVHIFGDPTFAGSVRSAYGGPDDNNQTHRPTFVYLNGNSCSHLESALPSNHPYDVPTFEDGYELGTAEIPLPRQAIRDFRDAAQDGGVYLTGSREVALARRGADGEPMYGYVSHRKNRRYRWTDVEIESTNGILYIAGQVTLLGGTLDGQLTIASNTAIDIEDDVVYRESDENGPTERCDDMLGLVTTGDITVSDNVTKRRDCVIHADMVATNASFKAEHWANGRPRGTLTLYGGIYQKFRGPVGTGYLRGDDLVILTGYTKDYHYDRRLAWMTPPRIRPLHADGTIQAARVAGPRRLTPRGCFDQASTGSPSQRRTTAPRPPSVIPRARRSPEVRGVLNAWPPERAPLEVRRPPGVRAPRVCGPPNAPLPKRVSPAEPGPSTPMALAALTLPVYTLYPFPNVLWCVPGSANLAEREEGRCESVHTNGRCGSAGRLRDASGGHGRDRRRAGGSRLRLL